MPKVDSTLFGELAFLPFQAEAPVIETLEWLTDIITTHNGGEQLIENRSKPRQIFEYKIPLQYWKKASSFNTVYGALRKDWAFPIWTEGQYVGDVIADQTVINCETTLVDLREESMAVLISNSNYRFVEIESLSPTSVTLYEAPEPMPSCWLFPVRKGFIRSSVSMPTNGREGFVRITFQVSDNGRVEAQIPPQYLGQDIYYTPMNIKEMAEKEIEQRQDITDFELGPVESRTPWVNAKKSSPFGFVLEGLQEVTEFKQFLQRRAGKFRLFWLPTFENDIRLKSTGNIVSSLLIEKNSFTDFGLTRPHIAIKDNLGNWYPRTITSAIELDEDIVQVFISSPLNLHASLIRTISYLGLNRLETDRIQLRWIGNNVVICETVVMETTP